MTNARIIRDPIHRDLPVDPLAVTVIDTTAFQRLRYIRQNGLLHFVFPGAVHTRFAHSIGAMALAGRVFGNLFPNNSDKYLATVFEIAALLHDVGHCAFSHSIETVTIKTRPFFHTLPELSSEWGDEETREFVSEYVAKHPDAESKAVSHEQLGLLFIGRIFAEPRVAEACRSELGVEPKNVCRDVRAVLDNYLPPSAVFVERAAALARTITIGGAVHHADAPAQMLSIMHDLVSGTLDVDRLDYLIRDSFYTGVPYGYCDVDVLINGLSVANVQGMAALVVKERAAYALDDMLWSRYQLFLQVLNHKTNVALNAMLNEAIPEAIDDFRVGFKQPKEYEDFVEFTDDLVMSAVFSVCNRGKHRNTVYGKALVYRELPLHLGVEDVIAGADTKEERERLKIEKARTVSADPNFARQIRTWDAKSELVKPGPLPMVLSMNKVGGSPSFEKFEDRSAIIRQVAEGKIPRVHKRIHFFVDRSIAQGV